MESWESAAVTYPFVQHLALLEPTVTNKVRTDYLATGPQRSLGGSLPKGQSSLRIIYPKVRFAKRSWIGTLWLSQAISC